MNPNRPNKAAIRPLASIPHKEGMIIIGVHKNGTEGEVTVYMDDGGNYTVPFYSELVGWRFA